MEQKQMGLMQAMFGDQVEQERQRLAVEREHGEKVWQHTVTMIIVMVVVGLVLATAVGLWWRFVGAILFQSC